MTKNESCINYWNNGQDGSYLAEFLLKKIMLYGIKRNHHLNLKIDHLFKDPQEKM